MVLLKFNELNWIPDFMIERPETTSIINFYCQVYFELYFVISKTR